VIFFQSEKEKAGVMPAFFQIAARMAANRRQDARAPITTSA